MDIIRTHCKIIDSTNTWAKANHTRLPTDRISLFTADEQTAGRGRFQRTWQSPAGGNIYATFCFFLESYRTDIGNIPQVLALSMVEVLRNMAFLPELKWPNDVILSGKKVAGILCETTPYAEMICIILGCGLNVNAPPSFLKTIDRPATSLFAERGILFDLEQILSLLQNKFAEYLEIFLSQGFSPFYSSYCQNSIHQKGALLHFTGQNGVEEVEFQSFTKEGSLVVRLSNGEKRIIHSGEI